MERRSLWGVAILSLLTLGIYTLYWAYKVAPDIQEKSETVRIPSFWWLVTPILLFMVGVLFVIGMVASSDFTAVGNNTSGNLSVNTPGFSLNAEGDQNSGSIEIDSSPLAVVWLLVGLALSAGIVVAAVMSMLYVWRFAKVLDQATNGKCHNGSFLGLFLISNLVTATPVLALVYAQDKINEQIAS